MSKKALNWILIMCLLVALMGCGSVRKNTESEAKAVILEQYSTVGTEQTITEPVMDALYQGNELYMLKRDTESSSTEYSLVKKNLGSGMEEILFAQEERPIQYMMFALCEDDGYCLYTEEENGYYLIRYDAAGAEVSGQRIDDQADGIEQNMCYEMAADAEGNTVLLGRDGVLLMFDNEQQYLGEIESRNIIHTMGHDINGNVIINMSSVEGTVFSRVNFEQKSLQTIYENAPVSSCSQGIYPIDNNQYLTLTEQGIILSDTESMSNVLLVEWVSAGIQDRTVYTMRYIENGNIQVLTRDSIDFYQDILTRYILSDSAQQGSSQQDSTNDSTKNEDDAIVLCFGLTSADDDWKNAILMFNKAQSKYRIELKYYSSNGEAQDAETLLNAAIVSGNGPDMVAADKVPFDAYADKGVFVDLTPYLQAEGNIDSDHYFTNALTAYQTSEEIYAVVTEFMITTMMGKTSLVGERTAWTLEEMLECVQNHPEYKYIYNVYRPSIVLKMLLSCSIDTFIDKEGNCHFNSEEFEDILQFCKEVRVPDVDADGASPERIANGLQMLVETTGYTWEEYEMYRTLYGEPLTCIGYPCTDGSGSLVLPCGVTPAILSSSECPEGCWEFIQFCLGEEWQSRIGKIESHYPVLIESYEEKMEPYRADYEGNSLEQPIMSMGLNDYMLDIYPMTQEEYDRQFALIQSAEDLMNIDSELYGIIREEATIFFEGDKTVQETSEVIQNRASLYLRETH